MTTGRGRVKVSAAFAATVSGIKLPILVLIPRKTPLPNFESEDDIFDENESHEEHIVTANLITHQEPNNLLTTTISTETAISSSSPPFADAFGIFKIILRNGNNIL